MKIILSSLSQWVLPVEASLCFGIFAFSSGHGGGLEFGKTLNSANKFLLEVGEANSVLWKVLRRYVKKDVKVEVETKRKNSGWGEWYLLSSCDFR